MHFWHFNWMLDLGLSQNLATSMLWGQIFYILHLSTITTKRMFPILAVRLWGGKAQCCSPSRRFGWVASRAGMQKKACPCPFLLPPHITEAICWRQLNWQYNTPFGQEHNKEWGNSQEEQRTVNFVFWPWNCQLKSLALEQYEKADFILAESLRENL